MRFWRPGLGQLSSPARLSGWLAHLARRRRLAAAVAAAGALAVALLGVAMAGVFASPGVPTAAAALRPAGPSGQAEAYLGGALAGAQPVRRPGPPQRRRSGPPRGTGPPAGWSPRPGAPHVLPLGSAYR